MSPRTRSSIVQENSWQSSCTFPRSGQTADRQKYAVVTIVDPFIEPFRTIPNAYKTLMAYMRLNRLEHLEDKDVIACFEREWQSSCTFPRSGQTASSSHLDMVWRLTCIFSASSSWVIPLDMEHPLIIGWDFPFLSQEQVNVFHMHGYAAAWVLPEDAAPEGDHWKIIFRILLLLTRRAYHKNEVDSTKPDGRFRASSQPGGARGFCLVLLGGNALVSFGVATPWFGRLLANTPLGLLRAMDAAAYAAAAISLLKKMGAR